MANITTAVGSYLHLGVVSKPSVLHSVLIGEPGIDPLLKVLGLGKQALSLQASLLEEVNEKLPPCCWGTPEKVEAWISHKGLEGASDELRIIVRLTAP